ncbi:P-loop containing nucleoside triphosphate hydrolases superfamily protein [Wolffia australiana]
MAKGDDAVARKKNRASRKKGRAMKTKESVSARVAAIIASKRRRKSGKRRVSEGMCFTLPTPENPFNDRNDPVAKKEKLLHGDLSRKKKDTVAPSSSLPRLGNETTKSSSEPDCLGKAKPGANADLGERVSKYLILCLKAIQEATSLYSEMDEADDRNQSQFLACKWGIDFWSSLFSGFDVADSSGDCASREQTAWLVSVASDIISRRENEGLVVPTPFLVFLVPSQDRAAEARLLCKPLKALGIHTVSLHPGASLDHQVRGLKSCEPEFIISTPERLRTLVSMGAVDISAVSLLVVDGLGTLVASGCVEDIKSIKKQLSDNHRTVVFGVKQGGRGSSDALMTNLVREPVRRLPLLSVDL